VARVHALQERQQPTFVPQAIDLVDDQHRG
jgi:hypothetical protein